MRLAVVLLVAAAGAAPALAQPVAPSSACTYAACAIRVEPSLFSSGSILKGPPGQEVEVGSLGLFGGGLADVVEGVPPALDHAQAARRSTVGAAVTAIAGTVLLSVAVSQSFDEASAENTALFVGGFGLSLASGVLTLRAQRRQSRAVWEYNRAVAGE